MLMTFEQRLEGSEKMSVIDNWRKNLLCTHSQGGSEKMSVIDNWRKVEVCLWRWRSSREASVPELTDNQRKCRRRQGQRGYYGRPCSVAGMRTQTERKSALKELFWLLWKRVCRGGGWKKGQSGACPGERPEWKLER